MGRQGEEGSKYHLFLLLRETSYGEVDFLCFPDLLSMEAREHMCVEEGTDFYRYCPISRGQWKAVWASCLLPEGWEFGGGGEGE